MTTLMRRFSFPGGVPSHCAPETPGSFHEGGELGYSLVHTFGAVLDHPGLVAFCVVGDGEAETGPLATSWHAAKFLHPARDGAVLPILALNQYKIANPTLLARIPEEELLTLLRGYGYDAAVVAGDDPTHVHQQMATAVDTCLDAIAASAAHGDVGRRWPMIVLRTPKGWGCPPVVDGQPVEGTFRAHQVPLPAARTDDEHRRVLEAWMRAVPAGGALRRRRPTVPRGARLPAQRAPAHEREPGRERRMLLRALTSPTGVTHTVAVARPEARRTRPPACSGAGCAR